MNYRKCSFLAWCWLLGAGVGLAADAGGGAPAPTNSAAPVALAAGKPGEGGIRFQFDGLPYADVITRFAQMVNKPLIADMKVDGTLTFSDPRPYNYSEALDTLNLILSLKGVMLVESDRYLRLVPFKELPQMPLRIFHGLEHTGDAQPGEVVTVVLPLQNLDSSEIAQPASAMLSSAGSIAPLSRGRGLIVTDRLGNIRRIRDLLTEVDTASPVQRQMKSYSLLHASGAVLVDMINRTFGAASAPRRVEFNQTTKQYQQLPPDPNDYITAVFDDGSRVLVMFGPADRMTLAEGLIKEFEEKNGAPGEVKTFYPQSLPAHELARMIRQALPSVAEENEPRAVAATKTRLVVDPTPNRLIVAAPTAAQLTEIEHLIKTLDVPGARGGNTNALPNAPTVRLFRARVVEPESMVRILTEAMTRPGYRPPNERPFHANLDPATRSIILTGTAEEVDQAIAIASQLDSVLPTPRLMRFVSLKSGRASDLLTRLRPLYLDLARNLPGPPGPEVLMQPDDFNNRLILAGDTAELKLMTGLVEDLDVAPDDSDRQLKTISLKYASANWLATLLQQLYGRQFQTENRRLRVVLTPSIDDRILVLQAPTATMTRLEDTIRALDVEPARGVFEVRTYQLTGANATDLVQTLSRLFTDRQDWQKRPAGIPVTQPRFEADAASNCLIVAATREQLEQIDTLIKELRASVEVATEIRIFRLKFCDPQQMVTLLDAMLHDQAPALQGRFRASPYGSPVADYGKMRIAAAPVLDAVVIQGPPDKLRQAEELINSLDVEKTDPIASIQAIPLKYASANWLATLLQQLYGRQFQNDNPRSRVALTPSTDDRTLVLQAPPAMLSRLEDTIRALDVEPARGVFEVRTYQLTGANATDLVQTLSRLFADRQDWQKRPAGVAVTQPRFEADAASNCLIVAATREQLEQIDQLVKELRASVEVATEFRVFRLKFCDPEQMVTLLDTMLHEQAPAIQGRLRVSPPGAPVADYGKLRIAAAPVLDAVVIQGPPDKLRLAEELITSLDKEKTDSTSAIRTVHLAKARAEAVAEAVNKTLDSRGTRNATRRTIITPVITSNSLLLDGPPVEVEEMLKIIHDLDQESTDGNIEFHIYRLENGNAKEVFRVLNQMMESLARSDSRFGRANRETPFTMAIDDRSNSLVISGSPAAFKIIERLLTTLDQAPRHMERIMNLYTLVNADPFETASKLQNLYADRPREEQVSADADYFTSTVTVIARPQDFPQIEDQIRRLDEAAVDNSLQVRMVAIEKMPAAQMAAMLTNIYAQMSAGDVRIVERLPPRPKETNGFQVISISRLSTNPLAPAPPARTNAPALTNNTILQTPPLTQTNLPAQTNSLSPTNPTNQTETAALNSTNPPARPFFPEVVVAVDKAANALLLSGPAHELDRIQTIIRDLTRAAASNNTELRIFPLQEADPIVVARTLNELFRPDGTGFQGGGGNGARNRRANQGQNGPIPVARVVAVAESRSRSVIVRAQPTDFVLVESLLKQIDTAGTNAQINFRLVSLENSQADKVLPLVTQMLTELRVARPGEPVMVTRDPRGNALFVVARNTVLDQIESMIQKLDTAANYAEAEVAVIPLKNGNAAQLASVLQALLRPGTQAEVTPEARELQEQVRRLKVRNGQDEPVTLDLTRPIKIMADPLQGAQGAGNRVILVSTPDNLRALSAVVAMMDTVPSLANIRIFPLQHADAATVQRIITDLYSGPGATRLPPEDRPNVAIDIRTDALVVSGNETAFTVVTNLLSQLDREGEAFAGQFRLVALKHAKASQLASVLEQFFRAKQSAEAARGPSARGLTVTVTPDDRSNTLLITGSRESFDAIERMIAQLDAEQVLARTSFKAITLKHATASKLGATLTQLFLRRPAAIRGEAPDPITIVEDSWANALVVGASPEDMSMVESLITQLDSESTEAGVEVQVLPLSKADARQVAQTITTLYRTGGPGTPSTVTANVDERLNAVVVSAGQNDIKRIVDLVKKLDTDQVTQVHQVRIFSLTNARAVQLAAILTSVLNSKPTPLTDQSPSRQALLEFISHSPDGKELMTSALKEGILIAPDPRVNALVVSAPVEYMKFLERLISDLDALSPQVAAIKVFALKNADARQMMSVLTTLFHLQAAPQSTSNPRTIQYNLVRPATADDAPVPGGEGGGGGVIGSAEENALTVTVDLRSNSLLVGGTDRYVNLAEQIIDTLDSSPAQERKAEIYRLKNSRATDIQNALQNFLKQDTQLVIAAVGQQAMAEEILDREATIVAETNSNTLLISATPRFFTELKALVEQLDQPQRQVLIQVLLAEVTLTKDDELGVEWTYESGGNPATKTGTDFGVANALKNAGGFGSAISGDNFNFLFRALQVEERLHVLSRPQILTADNQLATIKVGQSVPLVTSSQTIALNGNNVNTFEYKDVGVTLTVTPRISPDGFVKMDVAPQITQLSSSTATVSAGVQAPIINQRLATTSVSVQSGQSIMVGGLISSTDDFTSKRFPILGSIPLLGALFRSNVRNTVRTELLIVLTPQVLINGVAMPTTNTTLDMTREQLDRATFKTGKQKDSIERQILEPLYPGLKTNAPAILPPKEESVPKPPQP